MRMLIMLYKLARLVWKPRKKSPQGFYNKIGSNVVTMNTPMKGINKRAVTTVDIEVIFNRTLGIIGSEEFDLHDLFWHQFGYHCS